MDKIVHDIIFGEGNKNPFVRKESFKRGDYHFVTNRGKHEEICYILKIKDWSNFIPQTVNGQRLILKTGNVAKTEDGDFFTYQVKGKVSENQMEKIKEHFINQIKSF